MRAALVIHPGALGDVLLAVPALRALRADGFAITIAAQPRIGALLLSLGVADGVLAFDTLGVETLFTDAPLAPAAPLARHLASAEHVVCWFGARHPRFSRRLRDLVPNAVIAPPANPPAVVWQDLLRSVGGIARRVPTAGAARLSTEGRQPISVAAGIKDTGEQALRSAGWDGASRVVVVHPGAGGAAKRWPPQGFAEVLAEIDATLVVHEGPADADAVKTFLERTRRPVLHLVEPPLPTLAGILANASAYLGNDSGISHLAAAVGARSVVLFTKAMLPWIPWSPTAHCVMVTTQTVDDNERRAVRLALVALL